jgi:hypothetical protein
LREPHQKVPGAPQRKAFRRSRVRAPGREAFRRLRAAERKAFSGAPDRRTATRSGALASLRPSLLQLSRDSLVNNGQNVVCSALLHISEDCGLDLPREGSRFASPKQHKSLQSKRGETPKVSSRAAEQRKRGEHAGARIRDRQGGGGPEPREAGRSRAPPVAKASAATAAASHSATFMNAIDDGRHKNFVHEQNTRTESLRALVVLRLRSRMANEHNLRLLGANAPGPAAAERRRGVPKPRAAALCLFLLPLQELVRPGFCVQRCSPDSSASARFASCAFAPSPWSAARAPASASGRGAGVAISQPSASAQGVEGFSQGILFWKAGSRVGLRGSPKPRRSAAAGVLGMGMAEFSVEVCVYVSKQAPPPQSARSVCT